MSDLKDFIIEDGVLTKYVGPGGDVVIPLSVKRICWNAFKFKSQLREIVIPEGVVEIGENAFEWCENLERVVLPNSLSKISPYGTFTKCNNLKTIEASETVFEMVWKTLSTKQRATICENSIKCGKTLRSIEIKTIKKSESFIKSAIEQNDGEYLSCVLDLKQQLSIETVDKYIEMSKNSPKAQMVLLEYKNKYYSPELINNFETSKLELELGNRERTDDEIKEIFSLKKFENGLIITSYKGSDIIVDIPASIDGKPILAIDSKAFSPLAKTPDDIKQTREKIVSVNIPKGVKFIGEDKSFMDGAFRGCTSLEQVVLPDSLVKIGANTFRNCDSLKKIIIPPKVSYIGNMALPKMIEEIIVDENNKYFCAENGYLYNTKKKELISVFAEQIELTESDIKSIREDAFRGNAFIKRVSLPKGLKEISNGMFYECTALEEVILPLSIVKIPTEAFQGCKNIKNIDIPDGVKKIERNAFSQCTSLSEVYIPGSVEMIGSDVFTYYGKKMAKIKIHASAGSYAETYAKKNKIHFVAE